MSRLICPHCNEVIDTKKLGKSSRKKSTGFFDDYEQEQNEIAELLRKNNIEFGAKSKRKED